MLLLSLFAPALLLAAPAPLRGCIATDGDTIRCGREKIRLLGIDAPEKGGRCRPGRVCAPGDPVASHQSLRRVMAGKAITIQRTGRDLYGRTLGFVAADGADLSCAQLRGGFAMYKPDWDPGKRLNRTCR